MMESSSHPAPTPVCPVHRRHPHAALTMGSSCFVSFPPSLLCARDVLAKFCAKRFLT